MSFNAWIKYIVLKELEKYSDFLDEEELIQNNDASKETGNLNVDEDDIELPY